MAVTSYLTAHTSTRKEAANRPPWCAGAARLVDIQTHNSVTVHTLAEAPSIEAGKTVRGEVDKQFRTYSMRAHTASHVVYGVDRTLFDDHSYGGFDIREDSIV